MNNHTPTPPPWTYDKDYRELVRKAGDGDYQPIGTFHNAPTPEDIEFLLRAVNAHEELLAACHGLIDAIHEGPQRILRQDEIDAIVAARQAIAQSGG